MMSRVFLKDIFVEIGHSKGRFLSIMLIVALGTAFFSGIKASAPDLKNSADVHFDTWNTQDIQVLSTLGFESQELDAIARLDQVEAVQGQKSMDTLMSLNNKEQVVKVLSWNPGQKLNLPRLVEGRMPRNSQECVLEAATAVNAMFGTLRIGDSITLYSGTEDPLSDSLTQTIFTIVGTAYNPNDLSYEHGTSTIGSGSVDTFIYVLQDVFKTDYYTEADVTVRDAKALNTYTPSYFAKITPVVTAIENISGSQIRQRIASAQQALDDKKKEAYEQLDDARKQLDDARRKLEDGKQQLKEGWAQLQDSQNQIEHGRRQLDEGWNSLADARVQIQEGWSQVASSQNQLDDAAGQLQEGWQTWQNSKVQIEDGQQQIDAARTQIEEAQSHLPELEEKQQELNDAKTTLSESYTTLQDSQQQYDDGKKQLEEARQQLDDARNQVDAGQKKLDESQQELDAARLQLEEGWQAYEAGKQEIEENSAMVDNALGQIEQGLAMEPELLEKQKELQAAQQALELVMQTIDAAQASYDRQLQELEILRQNLDSQKEDYALEQAQIEETKAQLEAEKSQLDSQKEQCQQDMSANQQALADVEAKLAALEAQKQEQKHLLEQKDELAAKAMALQQQKDRLETEKSQLDSQEMDLASRKGQLENANAAPRNQEQPLEPSDFLPEQPDLATSEKETLNQQYEKLREDQQELQEKQQKLQEQEQQSPQLQTNLEEQQKTLHGLEENLLQQQENVQARQDLWDQQHQQLQNQEKENAQLEKDIAQKERQLAFGDPLLQTAGQLLETITVKILDLRQQVDDGKAQVDDALFQIEEGRSRLPELQEAQKQLEEARSQLEEGYQTLQSSQAQYEDGLVQLEKGKQDLADAREQIAQGQQKIDENERTLQNAAIQLQDGWTQYDDGKKQIEEGQQQLDEARTQIEEAIAHLPELQKKQQELDDAKGQLQNGYQTLLDSQHQYEDGLGQLATAKQQLIDAQRQFEEGLITLQSKEAEWQDGLTQLQKGKTQLEDSQKTLEEGQAEYEKGLVTFQKEETDALQKIADGQKQIDDLDGQWYVLDRNSHYSYRDYEATAIRMDGISSVFPVFFYLVAALVCMTTMTRMVAEERTEIGTFKALGYSRMQITAKYLLYAGSASLAGCALGCGVGMIIFPFVIFYAWNTLYNLEQIYYLFPIDLILLSSLSVMAIVLGATLYSIAWEMKEAPAQLMRPKALKAGKKIVLERLPWLWNRLSFMHKVTLRNLIRDKKRFFMTVIGIAGCSALLVSGFGLNDSISDIVPRQFTDIYHYDATVTAQGDPLQTEKELQNLPGVEAIYLQEILPVEIRFDNKDVAAYVNILEDPQAFESFMSFLPMAGTDPNRKLEDDGVFISIKTAEKMNLGLGDPITFKTASNQSVSAVVTGIFDQYIDHQIYVTRRLYDTWNISDAPHYSYLLQNSSTDDAFEKELGNQIMSQENVKSVTFYSSLAQNFLDMIAAIKLVVVVLVVSAAMLAFVVLYNLSNVNISERMRELATIKVLGFTEKEVNQYINRETLVLAAIGAIAGLFVGIWLHDMIMGLAELDNIRFGRTILWQSFAISAALTMIFTLAINWMMKFKIRKIQMVESLKAVE